MPTTGNSDPHKVLSLTPRFIPIFPRFFTSYINFFYNNENVTSDEELMSFWECIDLRGNLWTPSETPWRYGLPTLNKESLADYLSHVAFNVTAWHEHVGTILHYLLPSSVGMGMGLKIRPGKEEKDVQVCSRYLQSFTLCFLKRIWDMET